MEWQENDVTKEPSPANEVLKTLINICASGVKFVTKISKTRNFYESIEILIKLCHLYVMFVTRSSTQQQV